MTKTERLFNDVLSRAIAEVRERGTDVYTFAFYHDHESAAVSVCVDTEESSGRSVQAQNAFSMKYFAQAIASGDLEEAALWKANAGRSLSLGDFALVNVARTRLARIGVRRTPPGADFYVTMIRTLRAREAEIVSLTTDPQRLLFCSSSSDDEVGFVWSVGAAGRRRTGHPAGGVRRKPADGP